MNNKTTKKDLYNGGQSLLIMDLRSIWQGWRDLNPRPSVLETDALAS